MLFVVVVGIWNVWNYIKESDELCYVNKFYDIVIVVVFVIFVIFGLLVVNVKVMRVIKKYNEREVIE